MLRASGNNTGAGRLNAAACSPTPKTMIRCEAPTPRKKCRFMTVHRISGSAIACRTIPRSVMISFSQPFSGEEQIVIGIHNHSGQITSPATDPERN